MQTDDATALLRVRLALSGTGATPKPNSERPAQLDSDRTYIQLNDVNQRISISKEQLWRVSSGTLTSIISTSG
jgi:hypothetical protein